MDQRLRSHQTVWIMAERLKGAVVYESEILQSGFAAIGPLSGIEICKILEDSVDIAMFSGMEVAVGSERQSAQ